MKYSVSFAQENIDIHFSLEDGDVRGEGREVIHPGESFFYLTYQQLRQAGEGAFELDAELLEQFNANASETPDEFPK